MNTNEFIEEGRKIHADKYDYSKFIFVNMNTKGIIICPIHGEFEQTPKAHIRQGYGCRKCGRMICAEKTKKTNDQIILEFKKVHGDKYDYSKVNYVNAYSKVKIICPIHGEFEQVPHDHLKGVGCPKCGLKTVSKKLSYDEEEFLQRAREIHGNFYDYSKTDLNNRDENGKIVITCPIHGDFKITPIMHLHGQGCKECGKERVKKSISLKQEEFLQRAKEIHGNFYDYSKTDLNNRDENGKVIITCPIHGDFKEKPTEHLHKHGCPICGKNKPSNTEEFIEKAIKVHSSKYIYDKVDYEICNKYVTIICPKHGEFLQTPSTHLEGKGCPKCGKQISNAEDEIIEFCKKHIGEENVTQRDRMTIKPYELDIVFPTINYAIEYNGLRWHSEKFGKDRYYHLKKLELCKEKKIKLLQIFEDEYINKKDIVYNKIKHILKLDMNLPKIMGRKCVIKEIKINEANKFLDIYHIQGFVGSTVYLGAFYDDELVAVMTFKKEYRNCDKWELNRFASNYNYICQGVGGKLFKYFINNYNPLKIKSFADRRWTVNEENNIYIQLGFKFKEYTKPDYHYFKESDGLIRQHKFGFRKQKLNKKYGFPLSMSEEKMTEQLGYTKIFDCGLIKYIWNKKEGDI